MSAMSKSPTPPPLYPTIISSYAMQSRCHYNVPHRQTITCYSMFQLFANPTRNRGPLTLYSKEGKPRIQTSDTAPKRY